MLARRVHPLATPLRALKGAPARRLCDDALAAELGLRRGMLTKQLARQNRRRRGGAAPGDGAGGAAAAPPPRPQGPVARVSTARLQPDHTDAAAALSALYASEARELFSESDGFIGSLLLLDEDRTRARSITMWRDRAAMDAVSEHPRYRDVMGKVASHFAAPPDSEAWELGASFFAADGLQAGPPAAGQRPQQSEEAAAGDERSG